MIDPGDIFFLMLTQCHAKCNSSGPKLIAELQQGIERFRYLVEMQERTIQSCRDDIVYYMEKLKKLDEQTEVYYSTPHIWTSKH